MDESSVSQAQTAKKHQQARGTFVCRLGALVNTAALLRHIAYGVFQHIPKSSLVTMPENYQMFFLRFFFGSKTKMRYTLLERKIG